MSDIDIQFLGPDARSAMAFMRRAETAAASVDGALADIAAAEATALSAIAAAAAAADLTPLNGTLQRWLDLVTLAGSSASSATKAVLLDVEHQLRYSGLLPKIVRLDLFRGNGAAAARIPFVRRAGCGNASATGTISSWSEATGLTGATLDTGVTLSQAGLGGYNIGLGCYTAADATSETGFVVGGSGWGLDPYSGSPSFATANFITFDFAGRVTGDISSIAGGGSAAYRSGGMMHALRLPSGVGCILRNQVRLNGGSLTTFPDATGTIPTDTIKYGATVATVRAGCITDGMLPDEAAMLGWIIHNSIVAMGWSPTGEGL